MEKGWRLPSRASLTPPVSGELTHGTAATLVLTAGEDSQAIVASTSTRLPTDRTYSFAAPKGLTTFVRVVDLGLETGLTSVITAPPWYVSLAMLCAARGSSTAVRRCSVVGCGMDCSTSSPGLPGC